MKISIPIMREVGFTWPLFFLCSTFLMSGCFEKNKDASSDSENLVRRGRSVYVAQCTACHNQDPRKDGALGPAIADSSIEMLRIRVIDGKYPKGYKPKRSTTVMVPLPHLKNDIEALHAFISPKR